jgi:hypothetical protein
VKGIIHKDEDIEKYKKQFEDRKSFMRKAA